MSSAMIKDIINFEERRLNFMGIYKRVLRLGFGMGLGDENYRIF